MKNVLSKKMIFILMLILPTFLFSQAKELMPEPPAPPKFDFNFDFQDFQEMDQKTQNELLQKLNKDLQKELKVIQEFDKQKYLDLLRESQFKNMEFPYLVKREKEMHEREKRIFELEVKTESLAAQYEKANKTEKEKIKNELKQKVSELFTEKEAERKNQVAELEQELVELKKSLEVRLKNKNEIINRRLQELLHEDKYLDWE